MSSVVRKLLQVGGVTKLLCLDRFNRVVFDPYLGLASRKSLTPYMDVGMAIKVWFAAMVDASAFSIYDLSEPLRVSKTEHVGICLSLSGLYITVDNTGSVSASGVVIVFVVILMDNMER
ncbi:hypothetical protein Tco_0784429 [Tanacetum coccineum]